MIQCGRGVDLHEGKATGLSCSLRVRAALVIMILSVLFSDAVYLGLEVRRFTESPSDKITEAEKRFCALKPFLAGNKVIGYISDLPQDAEYAKLQYVVSPVIVVRGTSRPLVVGNFHKHVSVPEISGNPHLVLVKEFDGGIQLFRNEKER